MNLVKAEPDHYCEHIMWTTLSGGTVTCGRTATLCDLDAEDNRPDFFCEEHAPREEDNDA